jgi:hypothetical protein
MPISGYQGMNVNQLQVPPVKTWAGIYFFLSGVVMAAIGIMIGSSSAGSLCGSVFDPDSTAAAIFDSMVGSYSFEEIGCQRKIAAQATPTWALIIIGVLAVLAGCVVRANAKSQLMAVAAMQTYGHQFANSSAPAEETTQRMGNAELPNRVAQAGIGRVQQSQRIVPAPDFLKKVPKSRIRQKRFAGIAAIVLGAIGFLLAALLMAGSMTGYGYAGMLYLTSCGLLASGVWVYKKHQKKLRWPLIVLSAFSALMVLACIFSPSVQRQSIFVLLLILLVGALLVLVLGLVAFVIDQRLAKSQSK